MKIITLLAILLISFSAYTTAYATGNDDNDCDHPRFLEHGCGFEGQPGADGVDGVDGIDGIDGIDGKDGRDGIDGKDGRDGIDGKDGVVPLDWINETRNWQRDWGKFSAATEAIQVHLPQDQTSRLTFGMARVHGSTGLGVGYAYVNEDRVAFTLGLGTSGGKAVGKASIGFEFGGDRSMNIKFAEPVVLVAAPVEPEPVVETEDKTVELFTQQRAIEANHDEDIQQVQETQTEIDRRLADLEAKRAADVRRTALYEEEQHQRQQEQKAYAQQAIADLKEYQ